MYEIVFLSVLALVWMIFAVVQDLKSREIANWLNFSLIIFALGFRFFWSLFSSGSFDFFYQGLIGLGIFFVLGNIFYYGKLFAGGDAKLFIALGPILPFFSSFYFNLGVFISFILIFLFVGALYGIIFSIVLSLKNPKKFNKEFKKQMKKNKKLIYPLLFLGLVIMVLGFSQNLLFYLGIFVFLIPYLYVYAKAVDESCMVKEVKPSELEVGDWLYQDIKVKGKTIKAKWDGLKKEDIRKLKSKKKVLIRHGIPFSPVFLISFIILLYFLKTGLWYSFW